MLASSTQWLLLAVYAGLLSQQIVRGCTFTIGASFLNATLARCLQRCRDSVGGCQRIAYNSGTNECVIDAGTSGCGVGWVLHTPAATCGYGKGTVSGACSACAVGTASHAQVGDLAGLWNLVHSNGNDAGQLQVSGGGIATYSKNSITGQFILFHTIADSRYPGAFYLQQSTSVHQDSPAGSGIGWDYAWLEDVGNATRLIIRRFCGSGPGLCAQQNSPEGSPFFIETLLGTPTSNGASLCPLLDGSAAGGIKGPCCQAVESVAGTVNTYYSGSFSVGTQSWQDAQLVNAKWNSAVSLSAMKAIQSAAIVATGNVLCSQSAISVPVTNAVVFAMRGDCEFAQKAYVAQAAGARAIIVINSASLPMPPELIRTSYPNEPSIPTWMISAATGSAISTAVNAGGTGVVAFLGQKSSADTGSLKKMCCQNTCATRVIAAQARVGVPNLVGTCAGVDCTGYVGQVTTSQSSLPNSDNTCNSCEAGLASTIAGRANCGRCYSGGTANPAGSQCVKCTAGRAGSNGQCFECSAGRSPDSLSITCVAVPTPPTAAPTSPPAPTPPPTPPPPAPTPPPSSLLDRYQPTTVDTGSEDGGIPWGTIIIISVALLACCGCCYVGARVYSANSDAIEEHGVAGVLGSVLGVQGFADHSSGRADAETGDSENKENKGGSNEKEGDKTAGKQEGGSTGKSMTFGGVRVNFT